MERIENWESIEAKGVSDFVRLPAGGYVCYIVNAVEHTNDMTGNKSLKVLVDIAGNDKQKGFFKNQYENNTMSEAKWPSGATKYLSLKKESLAYTKGFIKALENSNNGFKFSTSKGWEQINGLKCAGVFGWEEYEDNEGKTKVATKLIQFRSLDKLKEITIPKVKMLDGNFVDYDDYNEFYKNKKQDDPFKDVVEISDDDMPF